MRSFILKLLQDIDNVLEPTQPFGHQLLDILFTIDRFSFRIDLPTEFERLQQEVHLLPGAFLDEHFNRLQFGHLRLLVVGEVQVVQNHFIGTCCGFQLRL